MCDIPDKDNIYSGNLLEFYKLGSSADLVEEVIKDDNLLFRFYPYKEVVRQMLEKNELYRFPIIDFFANNIDRIIQREQKIKSLLRNNNLKMFEFIYRNSSLEFNFEQLKNKRNIIESITLEKELYESVILSRTTQLDFTRKMNIEDLTNRLILLYYFNVYFKEEKSEKLNIEDTDYEDFIHMAIKNKDSFYVIDGCNDIVFKKSTTISLACLGLTPILTELLYYFDTLRLPCQITKNVISWFYVFFNRIIPSELHNEILYIMTGIKKNIIGVVMHLLSSLKKEYCNITDEEIQGVLDIIETDYVYKMNEEIENKQDIKLYINNLILVNQLQNNKQFKFMKDIRTLHLDKDNLFFISMLDPLKENWNSVEFYIQKINRTIPKDRSLLPIFNALSYKMGERKTKVIIDTGLAEFNIEDVLSFFFSQKIIDRETFYYSFLLTLSNYEIIIFNKEICFRTQLNYYQQDINSIKEIFNLVYPTKDFYNGYNRP